MMISWSLLSAFPIALGPTMLTGNNKDIVLKIIDNLKTYFGKLNRVRYLVGANKI